MGQVVQMTSTCTDVFVSWLPLYRRYGLDRRLAGQSLLCVPARTDVAAGLSGPAAAWLWAIHKHRGTLSAGPDFSYEVSPNAWPATWKGLTCVPGV